MKFPELGMLVAMVAIEFKAFSGPFFRVKVIGPVPAVGPHAMVVVAPAVKTLPRVGAEIGLPLPTCAETMEVMAESAMKTVLKKRIVMAVRVVELGAESMN